MRKTLTIILSCALLLEAHYLSAQTTGAYRSTTAGGNWNGATTWQTWNGVSWASTSTPPNGSTANVEIQGNVTIPSGVDAAATSTTVLAGKTLTVANGGKLTIGPSTIISGSGSFDLQAGGTLKIGHPYGISKIPATTGNIQVTSTRTFSPGAYYHYVGTSAQITGNGLPTDSVRALVMNNSKGLTVTDSVKITGFLSLTSGRLFTSTGHELTMKWTGVINGGSGTSFVYGPHRQEFISKSAVSRTFPIGNFQGYRPVILNITHNKASSCIYEMSLFAPVPFQSNLKSGVGWVDPNRYWKISTIVQNAIANQRSFTFVWAPADGVPALSRLIVAELEDNGGTTQWAKVGGSLTISGTVDTGSVSFSDNDGAVNSYVLASDQPISVLPVELTAFNIRLLDQAAHLSWTTASEYENDRFEVERSLDGITFEIIGTVKGHGTAQVPINYAFEDGAISRIRANLLYYRLKQVDHNGAFEYSSVKTVRLDNPAAVSQELFSIYPNPTLADKLVLHRANQGAAGNAMVEVFNSSGLRVHTESLQWNGFESSLKLPQLPSGVYHMKVSETAGQHHLRLLLK